MALPAPRSPLDPQPSRRPARAGVDTADGLAPARGVMVGLGLALALFWGPLAAGLVWLLD
ncbi:MAG: hypothetical protein R3C39_05355 [Dehalococcoidia bacterium]